MAILRQTHSGGNLSVPGAHGLHIFQRNSGGTRPLIALPSIQPSVDGTAE